MVNINKMAVDTLDVLVIRGYCFNKQCIDSIYKKNPKTVNISLEKALEGTTICENCGQRVLSDAELDLSSQILTILNK